MLNSSRRFSNASRLALFFFSLILLACSQQKTAPQALYEYNVAIANLDKAMGVI